MNSERALEWLDPASEECYGIMAEIIKEEISVRIALKDDNIHDSAWVERVAGLAADALLNRFSIRARTPDNPRSRWSSQHDHSTSPTG